MHRLLPAQRAPRSWSPRLRPWLVRIFRPLRRWLQRHDQQLHQVEILGLAHLQTDLAAGHGVLISPNHYCFTDPYVLAEAADRAARPFYYMTAWQAIGLHHPLRQL